MSQPSDFPADDLVRLWQESLLPAPDPARLTSQLARMAVGRFDRTVFWRNAREYVAVAAVTAFAVWRWTAGDDRVQAGAMILAAVFVGGYLWWQHRRLPTLDPGASARAYQAALLARIDGQIALIGSVRYWYLLPLYVPIVAQAAQLWRVHQRTAAIVVLVGVAAVYAGVAYINERLAVALLRAQRARVAALYDDNAES